MAIAETTVPAPRARRLPVGWLGWAAYVVVLVALIASGSTFAMYLAGIVIVYALSALGLDWVQGRAGQVSIGNAAFMAIGAYTTATLAELGFPLLVTLPVSALAGAVVGFVVGLPALRLRGLYLALSTLALQFITVAVAVWYEGVTHHSAGFAVVPPKIGDISLRYGPSWLIVLAVILAIVIVLLRNLYSAAPGRAWLAIKESQMAAAVIGLNPTRWKLQAFVVSSALISFSGSLLAYYTMTVSSETFNLTFSISFVAMVIIGGLGSIPGVILGATLVTVSPYVLSSITTRLPPDVPFAQWLNENVFYINVGLYGVIVLLFLLYQPRGLAGAIDAGRRRFAAGSRRGSPERGAAGRTAEAPAMPGGAPSDDLAGLDAPALADVAPVTALLEPVMAPDAGNGHHLMPEERGPLVLDVRQVRVVYRTGACAVDGIDLSVGSGEIAALLGRNGAGKTSTLRAISGFFNTEGVRLTGEILLDGRDVRGLSPVQTSRRGIVLVPERDKVLPNLTVAEHLRLVQASPERLEEIGAMFPPLVGRRESPAGLLSGGERQMLALALAFLMEPRLLLIDELSLGLAPAIISRLIQAVRELQARSGVSVLVVEQNIGAALELADRAYVIEAGRMVGSGDPGAVDREAIVASALGR